VKTPAKAPAKAAPKTPATAKPAGTAEPAAPKKPAAPRKRPAATKPADAAAEPITDATAGSGTEAAESTPAVVPAAAAPRSNATKSAAARRAQAARLAEVIKRAEATRQVAEATVVVESAVLVEAPVVEDAAVVEDEPVVEAVPVEADNDTDTDTEPEPYTEPAPDTESEPEAELEPEIESVPEAGAEPAVEIVAAVPVDEPVAPDEPSAEAVIVDVIVDEDTVLVLDEAVDAEVLAAPEPVVEPDVEVQPAAVVPAVAPKSKSRVSTIVKRGASRKPAVRVSAPSAVVAVVEAPDADAEPREVVLTISGLVKRYDDTIAVAGIDLEIQAGSFFGIVGPNGAGKTTTLSMVTGLLKPDAGSVTVHGADVWSNPVAAKRTMGVLPDRLRLFDRLTGAQLLYYSGVLHGLEKSVVRSRTSDLAAAFGLEDSLDRLVSDYSAGMTKKIAIAAAMIHSPRLLVFDEPFESVDPVSAANIIEILQKYVAAGGTVVISSHTMNLIERICDSVAVVVNGAVLATGTMAEVRDGKTLEERFVELAGGRKAAEGMEWLHKFSD